MNRHLIGLSLGDAIRILELVPVRGDMVPEITVIQVVNRAAMAHLYIERAFKFLIAQAGHEFKEDHNLHTHLRTLRECSPDSGEFLDRYFDDAVSFYGLNANRQELGHLRSLYEYLAKVGTADAFEKMRYWELTQSLDDPLIGQIWLPIHAEILYGLRDLFRGQGQHVRTIEHRVEMAVRETMQPIQKLAHGPGTQKEVSVKDYVQWVEQHSSFRDCLIDAKKNGFRFDNQLTAEITASAYSELSRSSDPAVQHWISRIDVLPRQPRNLIPPVDWLGPEKERYGQVNTPGGTCLGFIERTADGVWNITPMLEGAVGVRARAQSQTDARSYLAQLLTVAATVQMGDDKTNLRLVCHTGPIPFSTVQPLSDDKSLTHSHSLDFWDSLHGVQPGQEIKVAVHDREFTEITHVLEGNVVSVSGAEIRINGTTVLTPSHRTDPL